MKGYLLTEINSLHPISAAYLLTGCGDSSLSWEVQISSTPTTSFSSSLRVGVHTCRGVPKQQQVTYNLKFYCIQKQFLCKWSRVRLVDYSDLQRSWFGGKTGRSLDTWLKVVCWFVWHHFGPDLIVKKYWQLLDDKKIHLIKEWKGGCEWADFRLMMKYLQINGKNWLNRDSKEGKYQQKTNICIFIYLYELQLSTYTKYKHKPCAENIVLKYLVAWVCMYLF